MTNRGNMQSIIQTEKGEVLTLLWGKEGSGILPRRGSTWADSWMIIFLWKVRKGTQTEATIYVNVGKDERKASILTKQKAECIREQYNVKEVLKSGPVILSFGKLSLDSDRLRVITENWLVVSFVPVIYSWRIGGPGSSMPISQGLRIGLSIILKEKNWEILRGSFHPNLVFTHW